MIVRELGAHPATATAAGVARGDFTALEVTDATLNALGAVAHLNAVITVCAEEARHQAATAVGGPLAGVSVLVKDLFDTAGIKTTYGSAVFADHVPSTNAAAVDRVKASGGIIVGKANLHEFAWGVTSQNEHYGDVRNPLLPDRTPGGSSGGNAAALAACVCMLGIGTDTGGSVRIPAACCGVVGFKPRTGVIPTRGCLPLAPTFDTVGPMARSVRDCALLYSVLSGSPPIEPSVRGLRVGVTDDSVDVARFESLGARVSSVTLPEELDAFNTVLRFEAARSHQSTFPARRDDYGIAARGKWDRAQLVTFAEYNDALSRVSSARRRFARESDVDILVGSTLRSAVPPFGCDEAQIRDLLGANTRVANVLNLAALAIGPQQILGWDERIVLGAGLAWEDAYPRPSDEGASTSY